MSATSPRHADSGDYTYNPRRRMVISASAGTVTLSEAEYYAMLADMSALRRERDGLRAALTQHKASQCAGCMAADSTQDA